MPVKSDSVRRKQMQVMLLPEVIEYLDAKAEILQKGKRGARSEALNRCILFVKDFETQSAESIALVALGRSKEGTPFRAKLKEFCKENGLT